MANYDPPISTPLRLTIHDSHHFLSGIAAPWPDCVRGVNSMPNTVISGLANLAVTPSQLPKLDGKKTLRVCSQ
jgi:hypothetical protein